MSRETEIDRTTRTRSDWPKRFVLLYFGAAIPVGYIMWILTNPTPWREYVPKPGDSWELALAIATRGPILPMCPFLLYSLTCLMLLVVAPERFAKRFVVRFGVYTGVLLAVQYCVIAIAGSNGGIAAVWLVTAPLIWLLIMLVPPSSRRLGKILIMLVGVPLMLLFLLNALDARSSSSDIPIIILVLAPPWAVLCYANVAVHAARHSGVQRMQFSLKQLLAVVTWAAAYCAAWRIAFQWMLDE